MTLSNSDYRIVITGTLKGIICKNVFWYKAVDDLQTANALTVAFTTNILAEIIKIQSSDFQWTNIDTYNLNDTADFYTGALTAIGLRASDTMPVFNSWYIRYFRPTTLVHDGRKSIAGISEIDVNDGIIASGLAVTMDTVTDALEAEFIDANGVTYQPCIAQTEEYTNPSNGKTYRIPVELWSVNRVEYVKVSTQNSRKR